MIENKKASILLVLEVLKEYSDENHYLTQKDIIDLIYKNYQIELERKSIASSLSLLEELNYDIDKGSKGGFALLSRTFDPTEASFLIDAIFSSPSINGKQAKKIAESISSCFSKYQKNDYSYIFKSEKISRTNSKDVLYNISIIHEAINKGKRIGFQYLAYDKNGNPTSRMNGYQFIVSPYYLINNYGRYYLLCNYREKYSPLQTFRIEYMMNIEIKENWNIKNINDLKDAPNNFSITEYMNENIYMFGGNIVDAKIELENESAILYVKDWFGENAKIINDNDKLYASIKCNENALYYWIMQYSSVMKVISPESLVNKVKDGLRKALDKYI